MWQVLLAAAAAGSTGLVAKHIWSSGANPNDTSVTEKSKECDESCGDQEEPDDILKFEAPIDTKLESPMVSNGLNATANEGIFRFSSSGSRGATSSRLGSKNLRKKTRSRWRGAGKEAGGKNFEAGNCARELVMEQKRSSGRFSICLKKRRTNKNLGSAKSQSSCSSSDGSLFHWGLGVGIMYMMSAGKAEINKLNVTVDETAKVVQELKSELYKRKYSRHVQDGKARENSDISGCNKTQLEIDRSSAEFRRSSEVRHHTLSMFDDGECESSVLTEEPDLEMHELDQLEAELATELKKIPWCTAEYSYQAGSVTNLDKLPCQASQAKVSSIELHGPENSESHKHLSHGVVPAELDQKLCHLLIEQQENQIVELESELQVAQSKLNEKESELQALKDCVRRLTEFSLSTVSDDEAEEHTEKKQNQMGCEAMRSVVVGMKRPIESEFMGCGV
ncbi:protein POLAR LOCALIZATION DURING ASYMMETRIC DIVISION AND REDISTRIBUTION [Momordica charantia]|uniref:Protein POLAR LOCALIZATION DURING ASYMMETRIC DIVISION AND REDISTRIBUTION n=1 Tax=Momordica charantia TaxID=3673 RepID=A0A6J1CWQ8_MOMCH|nr:protein POLAR LOCALIZATION DURING ASYMMETRIC DIVISION AND REDISTRIBUTION [Momordica charantia]